MAEFSSSEAGKKGGRARAKKLSPAERSAIAKLAADKRWSGTVVTATHSGEIRIADREISCAVLEDGRRVLTQEDFLQAIGRAAKAKAGTGSTAMVDKYPPFIAADNLKPFIDNELRESTNPILYRTPTGGRAFGYEAGLLPKVCNVYLSARDAGRLLKTQAHIARACDLLMRGLAHVGIVALVDEATGYQRDRARDELAKILEAFVAKELQRWVKTFDLEFYELMCKLRREPMERAKNRPAYLGKLTNNLVYQRLAPGVLQKLQEVNPVTETGRRKRTHHQHLTPEFGHPKLKEHLAGVTTVMKVAQMQNLDWTGFLKMLDQTHPKYHPMPLLENVGTIGED